MLIFFSNIYQNYKNLIIIFLIAVIIRFIYFPQNIYFSYDHARDSFSSLEIIKGNLKVVGPPSSFNDNLFHSPLIYYIYAPIYLLSQDNPEAVSAFLRIYNSLGIVLSFLIAKTIFNKRVGIIAAFLFAISFEQSQYSIFFGHPGLAPLAILLFYLGMALVIFKKEPKGLILATTGLGLSIHFHYSHILLVIPFILMLLIYKPIKQIQVKYFLLSVSVFLINISPFVISELRYGFRLTKGILSLADNNNLGANIFYLPRIGNIIVRAIQDNFFYWNYLLIPQLILLSVLLVFSFNKNLKTSVFLAIWFTGGFATYLLTNSPSYYYNAGASVSLLIIVSFFISKVLLKSLIIGLGVMAFITYANLSHILLVNQKGPTTDFVIQPGMLLSDEKKIIDYTYQEANGLPFAVKAITIPLNINTTWSYLYEWYGKQKYGYQPLWTGPAAEGFSGNLQVVNQRSSLPDKQFLIIEPTVGIKDSYLRFIFTEEDYFTVMTDQKMFGKLVVEKRKPY